MQSIALALIGTVAAVIGLLAGFGPRVWRTRLNELLLKTLSGRALFAYLTPVAVCASFALLIVWRLGFPIPEIHDEFSYLLSAETFAAGRLTNPVHPFWKHFETFHVNQVPTHNSMYQPGQGLILAAGSVLFGHPWFGVLMSAIALALAMVWALRQWFSYRWALAGALMTMSGLVTSYWVLSYWGGCIPALGGALVFGSVGSLRRSPSSAGGTALGSGLVILLLSRPYEGFAFSIAAGICIGLFFWNRRVTPWQPGYRLFFAAACLIVVAGLSFQAIYSYVNTGSPWTAPYQINLRRYMMRPMFAWQPQRAIHYSHRVMEQLYLSLFRLNFSTVERFVLKFDALQFFARPFWLIVPFAIGLISWNRKTRLVAIFLLLICLALLFSYWVHPHYAAPATVAFAAITVMGLRKVYTLRSLPLAIRTAFVVAMIASPVLVAGADFLGLLTRHKTLDVSLRLFPQVAFASVGYNPEPDAWPVHRQRILHELEQTGRNHLILVRYSPTHNPHNEWVYNKPDIDRARVVWAREWNPEEDARLIEYFHDRQVWLLEADRFPYQLQSYPMERFKGIPNQREPKADRSVPIAGTR